MIASKLIDEIDRLKVRIAELEEESKELRKLLEKAMRLITMNLQRDSRPVSGIGAKMNPTEAKSEIKT